MVCVVLRIGARDLQIDDYLHRSQLEVTNIWRNGEASRNGRVNESSGFNLSFPEESSWAESLAAVSAHLRSEASLLRELRDVNAEVELDIGVTVGEEQSYAPSLGFPSEFLADLASLGISLTVSAYPTNDET